MSNVGSNQKYQYVSDPISLAGDHVGNTPNFAYLPIVLIFIHILSFLFLIVIFFVVVRTIGTIPLTQYSSSLPLQNQTNTNVQPHQTSTPNEFVPLSNKVKLEFSKGDYTAMKKDANQLIILASSNDERAIGYYWSGLASHNLKSDNDAETLLLKATALKPDYAAPYSTLGAIAMTRQDNQKMMEYSLKCVSLDSSDPWCHNSLGIAYLMSNQKEKGINELRLAVSLDPTSITFNENLKRALSQ